MAKWATLEKAVVLKKKKDYAKGLELLTALAEELDVEFLEGTVRRCEMLALMRDWDGAKAMCGSVIDSETGLEPEWCVFEGSFSSLFGLCLASFGLTLRL